MGQEQGFLGHKRAPCPQRRNAHRGPETGPEQNLRLLNKWVKLGPPLGPHLSDL